LRSERRKEGSDDLIYHPLEKKIAVPLSLSRRKGDAKKDFVGGKGGKKEPKQGVLGKWLLPMHPDPV